MNDKQKKAYLERYARAKQKGEKFFPDAIYKDLLVSTAMFVLLVLLAIFAGVASEAKADPSDSTYIPRPEWYFLFLFKFLAIYGQLPILGKIEFIATAVIPGIAVGVLFLLPFIDRSPDRHHTKRVLPLSIMTVMVVTIVTLTLIADIPTTAEPPYIPGILQLFSGLLLPGAALAALFAISFFLKKNANRLMTWTTGISSLGIIGLTAAILVMAPPHTVEAVEVAGTLSEQILAGTDLYSIQCVECHGAEGEGGEIKGVEGMEGVVLAPINSQDVMYTFTDDTLFNIIAFGQPVQGMPPYAKQFGGELGPGEVEAIVAFMRYTWDDRAELPQEVVVASAIPVLAEGEVPSYEVHVAPLIKRYCLSCHRPGKKNNEYLMRTYEEVMTSGENAPSVIPSDLNSDLIRLINREELEYSGPMPPTKALKPEVIEIFTRWVAGGAPNTAADAAAASAAAQPASPVEPTPTPQP